MKSYYVQRIMVKYKDEKKRHLYYFEKACTLLDSSALPSITV